MPVSGVVLGITTAVAWGSSDFLARFASRAVGSIRAVFWMQSFGALFLSMFLLAWPHWGHLFDGSGWRPWAWGLLAACINTLAMLALYRAFETGKMAIVAPISASYPALTVVLSLLSGERLSPYRAFGIGVALIGVLLVAGGDQKPTADPSITDKQKYDRGTNGIAWSISAAIGFGFLFWLLGVKIIPRTGELAAVWLIRCFGTLLTACALLVQKLPLRLTSRKTASQTAAMGLLDTGAFVLSDFGMTLDQVSVISVLGSLYGAVTVALGALVLRERIARLQLLGIISVFLGIFLMNR